MQPQASPRASAGGVPTPPPRDLQGTTAIGFDDDNPGLVAVPPPAPAPDGPRPTPDRGRGREDLADLDATFRRHNPLSLPERGGTPGPPDDAAMRTILSRVGADDAGRLAGRALAQVEDLGSRIEGEYRHAQANRDVAGNPRPSPDWPARCFPLVRQRSCLRAVVASLRALAAGEAIRHGGPTRAAVEAEFGEVVVRLQLSSSPVERFAEMHAAATRRRDRLAALKAGASGARARARALGTSDVDILQAIADAAASDNEASSLAKELAEADQALSAIGPALASGVRSSVEAAGGLPEVAIGLVEAGLLSPDRRESPTPESSELARVEASLTSMGAGPTSDAQGKIAGGLQARHRELSEAILRRQAEARKAREESAVRTVEAATGGDLDAFAELSKAVEGRPAAFRDGFGAALTAAPLAAVERAGFRPFAAAVGFRL